MKKTLDPLPLPECKPSPEAVSKFMRINVDILKQEITEHIDKELKRFKDELLRHRPVP